MYGVLSMAVQVVVGGGGVGLIAGADGRAVGPAKGDDGEGLACRPLELAPADDGREVGLAQGDDGVPGDDGAVAAVVVSLPWLIYCSHSQATGKGESVWAPRSCMHTHTASCVIWQSRHSISL